MGEDRARGGVLGGRGFGVNGLITIGGLGRGGKCSKEPRSERVLKLGMTARFIGSS